MYKNINDYDELLVSIEGAYADFGYSVDMILFIYYMPPENPTDIQHLNPLQARARLVAKIEYFLINERKILSMVAILYQKKSTHDHKNFIDTLKILDGVIIYNDLDIDESIPFEKQKYSFKEDILQVMFGDRFLLDVGCYPEINPEAN